MFRNYEPVCLLLPSVGPPSLQFGCSQALFLCVNRGRLFNLLKGSNNVVPSVPLFLIIAENY
jgi:hypothetical protein